MEDWTELTVTVPTAQADVATDIANMVVPYGVYIEDYSHLEEEAWEIAHIDLIDEDLLARDRTKAIIHLYISPENSPAEALAFLSERLTAEGVCKRLLFHGTDGIECGQLVFQDSHGWHLRCKRALIALEIASQDVRKDPGKGTVILLYHCRDLLGYI